MGLSETTVRHYTNEGLNIILKQHYNAGTNRFSDEILDRIVYEKRVHMNKDRLPEPLFRIYGKPPIGYVKCTLQAVSRKGIFELGTTGVC